MRLSIQRDVLLKLLQTVIGVIGRQHNIAILSNILLQVKEKQLLVLGSDGEVELEARTSALEILEPGVMTSPARKRMDFCGE